MEIKYNNRTKNVVPYSILGHGDAFEYQTSKYIKLCCYDGLYYNMAQDGYLTRDIDGDCRVTVVAANTTLVVEG